MRGKSSPLIASINVLLLLVVQAHAEDCEPERETWISRMRGMTMGLYISDPAFFWLSLWKHAATLATCMNDRSDAGKVCAVPGSPDVANEHNYVEGPPLAINSSWPAYGATVTGLHANDLVKFEGSPLLAQVKPDTMSGLCCLEDFSFSIKAPQAFEKYADEDPRPPVKDGKATYHCRKGNVVRNFAESEFALPIIDMGLFAKNLGTGEKVELPDYGKAFLDKGIEDSVEITDDSDTIKTDVEFNGQKFLKGTATYLTKELFAKTVNGGSKQRVSPCSVDAGTSMFYGVMAIEPAGRGVPWIDKDPIPIPMFTNSLLYDAHNRITFARVSKPRAYLLGVRFACLNSEITLKDYSECNMPDITSLREFTAVNGDGLRHYYTDPEWVSVKDETITFNKEVCPWDWELISMVSMLTFMLWSFGIVVKCKNQNLERAAKREARKLELIQQQETFLSEEDGGPPEESF